MCISFASTQNAVWVKKYLGVDLPSGYPSEAFPGYLAPLIIKSHLSGRVACGLAEFGLIPHWSKDRKIQKHTYNARFETISEKPSYRTPWKSRRYGIALVDHFYEPSYTNGKAIRTAIQSRNNEPLGIASIWDTWTDPASGEVVTSFSFITINADQHLVMNTFHKPEEEKRTPVLLSPHQMKEWLDATPQNANKWMTHEHFPELVQA